MTRVSGTLVHDLQHFEGLVLLAGANIHMTLKPGGEVVVLTGPSPSPAGLQEATRVNGAGPGRALPSRRR